MAPDDSPRTQRSVPPAPASCPAAARDQAGLKSCLAGKGIRQFVSTFAPGFCRGSRGSVECRVLRAVFGPDPLLGPIENQRPLGTSGGRKALGCLRHRPCSGSIRRRHTSQPSRISVTCRDDRFSHPLDMFCVDAAVCADAIAETALVASWCGLHRGPELPRQGCEVRYLVLVDVRPRYADRVQECHHRHRQVIDRHATTSL
jgi:hypothetical protein